MDADDLRQARGGGYVGRLAELEIFGSDLDDAVSRGTALLKYQYSSGGACVSPGLNATSQAQERLLFLPIFGKPFS